MDKPLKILHLFDCYLPNTMNWAYQLMRNTPLVNQWIAAPWMVQNAYFDPGFRFLYRPLQQKLHCIPADENQRIGLSSNLIRLEKRWPVYKKWLLHQLLKEPPDVLHAHFAPVGYRYLGLAKQLNVPLVVSFYGYDFQRIPFQKPVYRHRYREMFQAANAITSTGPFTSKCLQEQGCPPEKITVIPLAIPLDQHPWYLREKIPGRLRLVQVATITDKKGHLDTLKALSIALRTCPNIHLTLAGERQDSFLVRQMTEFIQANSLAAHVTWLGFLPHAELSLFLQSFDVFIHPSRLAATHDSEGAPVAILEAQASGLPVIATTHADIPAEVLHGLTGLLTPERQPALLAQSMEVFYKMGNVEYQKFSVAARQHMEAHFMASSSGEKLKNLYQAL